MHILVVEDDHLLNNTLCYSLNAAGYKVDSALCKQEAENYIEKQRYELIVLDVNLPDGNGFDFCKEVKERCPETAVIFLTANDMESDMLKGFELGADDYVTKPFSPKILIAKIKALLKRTISDDDDFNPTQDYNGLTINKLAHEVKINNEALTLSPKEFELLVYLSDNMGISLSRDVILDNVWGIDYYGDLRTVDTNIKRLREKLGTKSNYIVTVRGSGYKFEVQNEK